MRDGAASDRSRDEAWEQSRTCPYCHGSGLPTVYARDYDGLSVAERPTVGRDGEVVRRMFAQAVAAHCICPMGEWISSRTDVKVRRRIPLLLDVLAGRTRWQAEDPTGTTPGYAYRARSARATVGSLAEKVIGR